MGGFEEFGRVGRALLGHILGSLISKGRYHGVPMVKIILKILVKFPMVK